MNLIDRYIVKQFVQTLVFGILALCMIFLIVNLLEKLDSFLDQNATISIIAKYYLYFFPEIIKMLTPVATLIATLFTIGKLSTLNEITAMKSGGMSLYRLMAPLLIVTIILSFLQLYFNGWVVPIANAKKKEIEQKYLNKNSQGASIYNLYLRDTPLRNVIMQYYDANIKEGNRVSIDEFTNEKSPRLTQRIEANTIKWNDDKAEWIGRGIVKRTFNTSGVVTTKLDSAEIPMTLKHDEIEQLRRLPEEMNFDDLWNYINILKIGGKDIRKQLIDYYSGWAFPFANIIVVLFGVPFASVRRKGGIAIQIAAAMIITFAYLIFTEVSKTLAFAFNLEPVLSGWIANLIFLFAGLITIVRTKT